MAQEDQPTTSRSQADKDESRRQNRSVSGKQAARSVGSSPRQGGVTATKPQSKSGTAAGGTTAAKSSTSAPTKSPSPKSSPAKGARLGTTKPGAKPAPRTGNTKADRSRPAGGGNQARGGSRGPAAKHPRGVRGRSRTTLFTWGAIGLVIVVVAVLVIVKVTGSNGTSTGGATQFTPLAGSVAQDVSNIPTSVYDKVGISSPATPVTPPTIFSGSPPPLTIDGKPGFFYLGGEFCPYCAAERWAIVTSLERFGKFSGLGEMASSSSDAYPNTQTFTFYKASLASPYVGLRAIERYSNIPDTATGYYMQLEPLTKADQKIISTYYTTKYLPGVQNGTVGIPFIDIGNKAFIYQSSQFSPSILAGLTRQQIASGLDDPTNPVTQAILASSNYLSASVCATNGNQPSSVCSSKGVMTAAKALKLNG